MPAGAGLILDGSYAGGSPKGMQALFWSAWGETGTDQCGDVSQRDSRSLYPHINGYFLRSFLLVGFVPSQALFM